MRTYKMATNAISASANAVVSMQILRSGRIRSIRWSAMLVAITVGTGVAEISFSNISQIATNNTVGVVDELKAASNLLTSGLSSSSISSQRMLDIPVNAGEILYLNAVIGGTAALHCTVFIDVEEKG